MGAKKQFFGCVLVFLGLLNSMLSLKAGLGPDWLNAVFIVSGGILIGAGALEARRQGEGG